MTEWIKIVFLGLLAWFAWRVMGMLSQSAPTAVYQFGDIISAPSIVGAMPGANVGNTTNTFRAADPVGVSSSAGPAVSAYDGLRAAAYRDPRRGYEMP